MSCRLLRIEATNIYDNLLDCTQLSVMRGASLSMRSIVQQLAQAFGHSLVAVSTGASAGLFEIKSGVDAQKIRGEVVDYLQRFARDVSTFVVDVSEDEAPKAAIEKSIALNRFRQMREASTIWTDARLDTGDDSASGDTLLCAWSDRWPAQAQGPERDGEHDPVAQWVKSRYDRGRESKQAHDRGESFYRRELKPGDGETVDEEYRNVLDQVGRYYFAHDLHDIADLPRTPGLRESSPLDGKVAVIYADGNQFSRIQNEAARGRKKTEGLEALRGFDRQLQRLRRRLLASLLQPFCDEERADLRGEGRRGDEILRLETLLWGGDEMTLVVPAWHGLTLLQQFFERTAGWRHHASPDDGGTPLTHSAGIVFAHAKTPIHLLDKFARELAEEVKAELRQAGRCENAWSYLVLESADVLEQSPQDYRHQRYGALGQPTPLRPPPKQMLMQAFDDEEIRHGSLRWVRDATTAPLADRELQRRRRRFKAVIGDAPFTTLDTTLEQLFQPLTASSPERDEAWRWAHLCELWDYLPAHAIAAFSEAQEAAA